MISSADLSGKLALDAQGLDGLRGEARRSTPEGLKAAARQFEALFMNMMLKSMREATPQDGMFDTEQTRLYTSMLDQQLSQSLAARGVGLADIMVKQLSRSLPIDPAERAAGPVSENKPADVSARGAAPQTSAIRPSTDMAGFQARLLPHAQAASRITGVPAQFMLGQAALESDWGRREIRTADGTVSHNLFGVKAGSNWKGSVVEALTTEYVNGDAQKKVEKFRAYTSYAEAFCDYASLLRDNPRYASALAHGRSAEGFAHGLQRAGYATDPNYAEKLTRIIKAARWI